MPEFVYFRRMDRDKTATYVADVKNKVVTVPAGQYRVWYSLAASRAKRDKLIIDSQHMLPIDLIGRTDYTLKWGFPMTIGFTAVRARKTITIGDSDNPIRLRGAAACTYTIEGGKAVFLNPPNVEFHYGGKREVKKQAVNGMAVTVKNDGKYKIIMVGKSVLFGELRGEIEK